MTKHAKGFVQHDRATPGDQHYHARSVAILDPAADEFAQPPDPDGIHPDVLVCRSTEPLTQDIRDKIALFADVDVEAVVSAIDLPEVYLVPKALQEQGLDRLVCEKLGLDVGEAELGEWDALVERLAERREHVEIALVGKYVKLHDAYLSVHEALKHAGIQSGCHVSVRWVDAENTLTFAYLAKLPQRDSIRARRWACSGPE